MSAIVESGNDLNFYLNSGVYLTLTLDFNYLFLHHILFDEKEQRE